MRLKQSRIIQLGHKKRIVQKNSEGSPKVTYGEPEPVPGYSWPGAGQVQAAQYGDSLPYVRNIRLEAAYETKVEDDMIHYILPNGVDIVEKDLMIIDGVDHEIRAIKPYRHLYMEAVRI